VRLAFSTAQLFPRSRVHLGEKQLFLLVSEKNHASAPGLTMMIASKIDGYRRYRRTNGKRSVFHRLTRASDLLLLRMN
jgi:hypothetical protein